MATCVYCQDDSSESTGRAHVVPESVAKNSLLLPVGAVCDPCNNYLGRLDEIIAGHPMISAAIQLLRLPGKKGRRRNVVGNVSTDDDENAIVIPVRITSEVPGQATATVLYGPQFNDFLFRRSLHHVALNLIAYADGIDRALSPDLDEVRRYVRQPRKKERWAFAQLVDGLSPKIRLARFEWRGGYIVAMRLLSVLFYVDLHNHQDFAAFIDRERRTCPELLYVDPSYELPIEDRWDGRPYEQLLIDHDLE